MKHSTHHARLFLNDVCVGDVHVHGWHDAWGFGRFTPNESFSLYAPIYQRWAQLMHEVANTPRLTRELSKKLRDAEYALYEVSCELYVPEMHRWHTLGLLNIDDTSIEWKESGPARVATSGVEAFANGMAS